MIKMIRAFVDSQGVMHATQEQASKAEFRRLLTALLDPVTHYPDSAAYDSPHNGDVAYVPLDAVVEAMFELDKMIAEATRLDTRADIGSKGEGNDANA